MNAIGSGREPQEVSSPARGLTGHLTLVADVDAHGLTRLQRQSFCAPVHLSKPHREAGVLVLNMVNPTAGLLEGDRLEIDISVERGARLLVTTPSANRIHAMPGGGYAQVTQRFQVAADGSLDFWPEILIPQRAARYHQRTTLEVETGAELLFFESLAPGRTAMGEVFAFTELRWATDFLIEGRLLCRERYRLTPEEGTLTGLRGRFPAGYYASALLVAPKLTERSDCWKKLLALQSEEVWSGVSRQGSNAFAWRVMAAGSLALRRTLRTGRTIIYAELGRNIPDLRRTGERS